MVQRILLVEDDSRLAPLVRDFLADHHFQVRWAANGDDGWRSFVAFDPELVVLDLMLPGRDGLTLCRQIREAGRTGIIILTARGDESDRVAGLELGADDYLTKPFGLPELLARVRAILRRCNPASEDDQDDVRTIGPFTIHGSRRTLARAGTPIELTRSEFDIVDLLTRRPGRVYTRDELLQEVRGGETGAFDRAVDTHISNLRAKIETDPRNPRFIETVWGIGYKWAGS